MGDVFLEPFSLLHCLFGGDVGDVCFVLIDSRGKPLCSVGDFSYCFISKIFLSTVSSFCEYMCVRRGVGIYFYLFFTSINT